MKYLKDKHDCCTVSFSALNVGCLAARGLIDNTVTVVLVKWGHLLSLGAHARDTVIVLSVC